MVVCVLYTLTGIGFLLKKNWPWAIVWLSYAMANVGLIWAAYQGVQK